MLSARRLANLIQLLAFSALLGSAENAIATVKDEPLNLRCLPAEAKKDQRTWTIEIDRRREGTISGFRAHGEGLTIDAAGPQLPSRFTVTARALRANYVLTIEYEIDGHPYSQSVRLESERHDVSHGSLGPVTDPAVLNEQKPRAPRVNPPMQPTSEKGRAHEPHPNVPDGVSDVAKSSRDITVHGRLVYQRPDGVYIGVDNARVQVYDEDITFDQVLATTATDASGYYSATFNWDPCFLCENNPDIYVRFESTNGAAVVESANLEITYSFETGTTDDFTGTDLNRGADQPSNQQAFQLLTNITRAWRWLSVRGYSTPQVEVKWPANSISATYYNPSFETIHILPEDEWHEATHVHEYGHHWTNSFGSFSIPTYTDLHCGIFGHCMWCSENATAAFIEGWADWLSDIITKSFSPASTSTDDAEALHVCGEDGYYNSAYTTEGFFAALLRDIEDSGNEDDGAFPTDGFKDATTLGTDEILAVADLDAPLSPSAFLSSFKARYPSVACELWETGRNNGYDLDVALPGVVSGLADGFAGGPLMCAQPYGERNITWAAATDDWSCVSGYSILIASSQQLPDAVQDIGAVTERKTGCLTSGDYYFNIRTRDRSGKWSSTFASHPFNISAGYAAFPATSRTNTWLLFAALLTAGSCAVILGKRMKRPSA